MVMLIIGTQKQLAKIFIKEENKDVALKLLKKSYTSLSNKEIYETFDYAEFLKNNEKFSESIPFYSNIIKIVDTRILCIQRQLMAGVAYERTGQWEQKKTCWHH